MPLYREDGSTSDQVCTKHNLYCSAYVYACVQQAIDAGIFWCVNFAWFHHHLRDEASSNISSLICTFSICAGHCAGSCQ